MACRVRRFHRVIARVTSRPHHTFCFVGLGKFGGSLMETVVKNLPPVSWLMINVAGDGWSIDVVDLDIC